MTHPTPETVILLLLRARLLISEPGTWGQGDHRTIPKGRRCALGAIADARGAQVTRTEGVFALGRAVGFRGPFGIVFERIAAWHDEKARTHAGVLAALDRAVEMERAALRALK